MSPRPNPLSNFRATPRATPAGSDEPPAPIVSEVLSGVAHGFFTRAGGVSGGIHAGLNVGLGSSDERAAVVENRRRVAAALGTAHTDVVTPYQIHSATVHVATGPFPADIEEKPRADAVVTDVPGLPIGVVTADCGPVLFADRAGSVVGAAHAGWKGAVGGVIEETVEAMRALGARDIVAVLGPTISQAAYEVGPEFVARFEPSDRERWFVPSAGDGHATSGHATSGHAMFDLPGYILARLERAGVAGSWTGHCTYADETLFSYRRATHRREDGYGRQMAAITL